ncbi:F-box protein 36 [Clonorchis sinensis]|uniref:F-box protein 36 n=1 Tax=Clonorchis sinensis TaxID=79923 RepID=G7YNU6_CLOSI|nr:F-box protein 36 [Clonorchis sinensis]
MLAAVLEYASCGRIGRQRLFKADILRVLGPKVLEYCQNIAHGFIDYLVRLPSDVMAKIISHLQLEDVINLGYTCKAMHACQEDFEAAPRGGELERSKTPFSILTVRNDILCDCVLKCSVCYRRGHKKIQCWRREASRRRSHTQRLRSRRKQPEPWSKATVAAEPEVRTMKLETMNQLLVNFDTVHDVLGTEKGLLESSSKGSVRVDH